MLTVSRRNVTVPQVAYVAARLAAYFVAAKAIESADRKHTPHAVAYTAFAGTTAFSAAAHDAAALCKISRSLHRLAEKDCNVGTTEADDKRESRLEAEAESIVAPYGLKTYHQGDPRGCALYVYDPKELKGRDIHSIYSNIGTACY